MKRVVEGEWRHGQAQAIYNVFAGEGWVADGLDARCHLRARMRMRREAAMASDKKAGALGVM